jgi:DNA-binding SARP family transcriptional activator/predicted ATPase
MLSIRLLGAAQIFQDEQEIQVPRRKSRALIYYLAANQQTITRQQLLALFWTDLPRPAALQTLRSTLHGLRQIFGASIDVQGDQVALAAEGWVDVRHFEAALGAGNQDQELLRRSLELYRGDFLEGFSLPDVQEFEDWMTVTREHYRRLAVRGWTTLSSHQEAQEDYRQALNSLDRALRLNPLQEDLQRQAIRLLYLAGDRPGAILRYDELRRLLDEEMGVPPMVETRALYDAILTDRIALPVSRAALPARQAGVRSIQKPSKPVNDLPFTGRGAELATLQQLVETKGLVLIEGEPGVGKTRLAEEVLDSIADLTLVGRGRELEQTVPYLPMIEAIRQLIRHPAWSSLETTLNREVAGIWLAEVARLLPELVHALDVEVSLRSADEARLWEGIRQFLIAVARRRSLALLIDDLHWADASTLGLLGYLARQVGDSPIRLLATIRPVAQRLPVSSLLQSLTRENRVARLPLARLNREDIQIVARKLSVSYAQPLGEWLYRFSEGNAYFLVELVRHARQTGLLSSDGVLNLSALPLETVVPQSIYSLIQSRLEKLSEGARRVLDAAVAQGREFDFEIVAQASGLSEDAALDGLDELQAGGFVLPAEGQRLRFDHTLTMEVAYREVGEVRHRLLHRRVAEAMENLYLDQPKQASGQLAGELAGQLTGHLAGQLAWHFAEGNAPQRAARYAMKAGAQASNLAAWVEASDFYELALQGLSGSARLPALLGLAEAFSRAGNYPRACEVLRDALVEAMAAKVDRVQVEQLQLALARSLMPQARYAEVIELAEQVRVSCAPESAATAELLWGSALSLEGAALEDAADHLLTAESLWRQNRSSDLSSLSQIQFELGNVLAQQGMISLAVERYRQALESAEQVQSDHGLEQRILGLNNLAYHLHLLEDPSAVEYGEAGLKLAQEKGVLGLQAYLYSTLGEISLAKGDLPRAESYFQDGLALAKRFSVEERVAGLTANLGLVAAQRGETTLAIHQLSTALGQADALGTRHLAAQVRIWLAPLLPAKQARQVLAQARDLAEVSGRKRLLVEIEKLEMDLQ